MPERAQPVFCDGCNICEYKSECGGALPPHFLLIKAYEEASSL